MDPRSGSTSRAPSYTLTLIYSSEVVGGPLVSSCTRVSMLWMGKQGYLSNRSIL